MIFPAHTEVPAGSTGKLVKKHFLYKSHLNFADAGSLGNVTTKASGYSLDCKGHTGKVSSVCPLLSGLCHLTMDHDWISLLG